MSERPLSEAAIFTWEPTPLLRMVREYEETGRDTFVALRLQQVWKCRETGETEWRGIPIVNA